MFILYGVTDGGKGRGESSEKIKSVHEAMSSEKIQKGELSRRTCLEKE
jgi:hypothetical protein